MTFPWWVAESLGTSIEPYSVRTSSSSSKATYLLCKGPSLNEHGRRTATVDIRTIVFSYINNCTVDGSSQVQIVGKRIISINGQ